MVAFNFTMFVDKVESRTKRMTIRKTARGKPGDKVQLYTGMRTKKCRKLVEEDPTLVKVVPVTVSENGVFSEIYYISKKDGFANFADFLNFFNKTYGLPFEGYAHIWEWPGPANHRGNKEH